MYKTALLTTLLTISCLHTSNSYAEHGQTFDTPQTFITTFFYGDTERSKAFMAQTGARYKRFLNHFVSDELCLNTQWGEAAEIGCRRAHAKEISAIGSGDWTRNFRFTRAEFMPYTSQSNVGTYNFEKKFQILPNYECIITMQLTAILNAPQFPINKEFFSACRAM